MKFQFDNSYARSLPGFYTRGQADSVPAPQLIRLNRPLAAELNLDPDALDSPLGAQIFSGNQPPDDADVLAQAYAGHQFGHFVPQLGDGRAVLYGEVIDRLGQRRDIQLKGSGRTPFSRGGDGKAAVGPVLREYILGEALHALGIPPTRALAAVTTGQPIFRNAMLPGAVLTRVAASHIRVGTFQFFAARQDIAKLRLLADYSIQRHYPHLTSHDNRYLAFLATVCDRQAALIARWMHAGFIHGVMNTDNMAISGETIDYGPCAFMDAFSSTTVFSSIDQFGRYAYGEQPSIARWNLARLAECLLPLIHDDEKTAVNLAVETVNHFTSLYEKAWFAGMRAKLGLSDPPAQDDLNLVNSFLALLEQNHADYTNAFRDLTRQEEIPYLADWLPHWRARRPNRA
ncbi:MAG: protein adenylyltransferase SelO, partial [Acidobacteriota bacterium]